MDGGLNIWIIQMKKKEKGKVNCFSYMGGVPSAQSILVQLPKTTTTTESVVVTLGIRTYVTFLSLSLLGFDIVLLLNISCALFSFIQMHLVCVSVQVSRESGDLTTFQFEKKRSFFKQQQRSIDILSLWIIQSKFSIMHLYWHAGDRVSAFTSGTIEKKKKGIFMYYLKRKRKRNRFLFPPPQYTYFFHPRVLIVFKKFYFSLCGQNRKGVVHFPLYYSYDEKPNFYFIFFFSSVCVFLWWSITDMCDELIAGHKLMDQLFKSKQYVPHVFIHIINSESTD